ncbi:MAG: hypothetical protein A2Y38_05485 [Spirochaetes bacterium GWB1_59_5]|nr:MAG: hypothetical protein A2Y38_05485 [Spirochaetes bacterium GWB1_59_5]
MAGKKGMIHRNAKSNTLRGKVWRSMRILKKFTIRSVLATSGEESDEGDYQNIKKWFRQLLRHGYIKKIGGQVYRQVGQYQDYILVRNPVSRPLVCDVCGQSLSVNICNPLFLEKETKKKKKTTKETATKKETPVQESRAEVPVHTTSKQWKVLKRLADRRHTHER